MLYEVNQTSNSDRKRRLLRLCDKASEIIKLDEDIYLFSEQLKEIGFKSYDALHLSCARKAEVEVFLSTDDKLVKKARKNQDTLNIRVDNPLRWLQGIL